MAGALKTPNVGDVAGPLEPSVGRPVDEATDAEGPRGTYGCACVSDSARMCALLRYPERDVDDLGDDNCECLCHQWREDDDDHLG